MTPSETSDLMAQLMRMYPREQVEPSRLRMYCELLADLEIETAMAALRRVVAKSEWFPSVAAIRGECAIAALDAYPEPELAWGEVLSEIRRVGMNREPAFANPHTAAAVDAMGWRDLCLSSEGDVAVRAQFREAYRASRDRAMNDARVPAVARTPDQRRRLGEALPILQLLTSGSERENDDEQS